MLVVESAVDFAEQTEESEACEVRLGCEHEGQESEVGVDLRSDNGRFQTPHFHEEGIRTHQRDEVVTLKVLVSMSSRVTLALYPCQVSYRRPFVTNLSLCLEKGFVPCDLGHNLSCCPHPIVCASPCPSYPYLFRVHGLCLYPLPSPSLYSTPEGGTYGNPEVDSLCDRSPCPCNGLHIYRHLSCHILKLYIRLEKEEGEGESILRHKNPRALVYLQYRHRVHEEATLMEEEDRHPFLCRGRALCSFVLVVVTPLGLTELLVVGQLGTSLDSQSLVWAAGGTFFFWVCRVVEAEYYLLDDA